MIKNLLENYKTRKRLFIILLLFVIVLYTITSFTIYKISKKTLYDGVDKTLINSAYALKYLLPKNFHDKTLDKNSISKEEDLQNIKKLSAYAKDIQIEYIYSMVQKDDKLYFTSSSATQDDFDENLVTYYYDEYESATPLLQHLIKNNKIEYEESTDKWGTFRSVLIPMETPNGNKYILGADVKINHINEELHLFIKYSFLIFIIGFSGLVVIYIIRKKLDKKEWQLIYKVESDLKNEIKLKTKELQLLTDKQEKTIKEKTKELSQLNAHLEERVEQEVNQNLQNKLLMMEQSRLASMGEMIGNIAHQWRQPLNAITVSATGVKELKRLTGEIPEDLLDECIENVVGNAVYLSETIDIFRNFIKNNKEKENVVLQDKIEEILKISINSLKVHHIEIKKDLCIYPINYEIVSGELSQVLINILNNAKDVLVEKNISEPWIKIELIDSENEVLITIEDNGKGIPEDILAKIFEPYFTTKHKSKGTGLGLHMSYKIITESLKGKIYAQNTDNGAKFYIYLPKESI